MSEEKEYLVDGNPVTWTELIAQADREGVFCDRGFKRTSEAAAILRNAGHTVENNTSNKEGQHRE